VRGKADELNLTTNSEYWIEHLFGTASGDGMITVQIDDPDSSRVTFSVTARIAPHQFCVVSKVQDKNLTVDQRFGRAIFEVFARFLTGQLAHLLAEAITTATTEAVIEIASESIYDVDKAIFENSIDEGASELEVLLRIFRSRQKPKLNATIQDQKVQNALRQMRDFRANTIAGREKLATPKVDLKSFRKWRYDEVFDDGKTLNLLHSPLACGDLFDVALGDDKMKRYILLAQPPRRLVSARGESALRAERSGVGPIDLAGCTDAVNRIASRTKRGTAPFWRMSRELGRQCPEDQAGALAHRDAHASHHLSGGIDAGDRSGGRQAARKQAQELSEARRLGNAKRARSASAGCKITRAAAMS
jgi:hypothetical protein